MEYPFVGGSTTSTENSLTGASVDQPQYIVSLDKAFSSIQRIEKLLNPVLVSGLPENDSAKIAPEQTGLQSMLNELNARLLELAGRIRL